MFVNTESIVRAVSQLLPAAQQTASRLVDVVHLANQTVSLLIEINAKLGRIEHRINISS